MVLMLAGMRGIDGEIWKAARVDGIPKWKTYIFVVIPDDARGVHHHAGDRGVGDCPALRLWWWC